nr:trihelix transcription factor ASIL2 [Ipomoea batatas]
MQLPFMDLLSDGLARQGTSSATGSVIRPLVSMSDKRLAGRSCLARGDSKENPSLLSNGGPKPKQESPRSLATAATTVMAASDRLKRDEWSEGAVSSLLEAYEAKWVLRNRAKLKGQDWDDVARHVSARGNSTKSPKT